MLDSEMGEREDKDRREPFWLAAFFLGGAALMLIVGGYPSRRHWVDRAKSPGEFYSMVLIFVCVGAFSLWWGYAAKKARSERPPE